MCKDLVIEKSHDECCKYSLHVLVPKRSTTLAVMEESGLYLLFK